MLTTATGFILPLVHTYVVLPQFCGKGEIVVNALLAGDPQPVETSALQQTTDEVLPAWKQTVCVCVFVCACVWVGVCVYVRINAITTGD